MTKPSLLLFGLGAALAGACAAQATSTRAPVTNEAPSAAASAGLPAGDYVCVIDDYEPYPCRVEVGADGKKQLAKLAGSQRVRGVVYDREDGFDLAGTFYCPWGACDEPVRARFHKLGAAIYSGKLNLAHGAVSLRLEYLGGRTYAAAMYGDDGYGYGGGVYGGLIYALNY